MAMSLILAGLGILIAFAFYQWKKVDVDKLASKVKILYNGSLNKWYIDEAYDKTAISGTLGLGKILYWFDANIVDGIVNGSAWITRKFSNINGWFDANIVDGLVNFTAFLSGFIGLSFKKLQTGKVQTYIVFVVFSIIILLFLFKPF
jgi:NADH-quinone oxidoreductase subunit L